MSNLYEIELELQSIFNELEENGGELTDDLKNRLSIAEEEGKSKLDKYCKYIKSLNANADICKTESKRLSDRRKSYNNRVELLRNNILDYILKFGNNTKTGKGCQLPTFNIYTSNRNTIISNEYRINLLTDIILSLLSEYVEADILSPDLDDYLDIESVLDVVNCKAKAIFDQDLIECKINSNSDNIEFIPFILNDLTLIDVNITTSTNLLTLLHRDNYSIIENYANQKYKTSITKDLNTNMIKEINNTISEIETKSILNIR